VNNETLKNDFYARSAIVPWNIGFFVQLVALTIKDTCYTFLVLGDSIMESCKYCLSNHLVKHGFVRSKQRYVCRGCGKNQVAGDKRTKYDNATRRLALAMYLNSSGLRSIGRTLNIPYQLVSQWIENAGKIIEEEIRSLQINPRTIAILEMDELYTYVQKNSTKFEYGWLLIGTEARLLRLTSAAEHGKMPERFTG
jgi:transposase-like protein